MKYESDEEILRARARTLARPRAEPMAVEAFVEVLEFHLAWEQYAVETSYVKEVCPFKELTPLPCTPHFVLGIVNVRGRILPVFDLKRFFDLPEKGLSDLHRIILIQHDDLELGFLADLVAGVRSIPVASLQPSLATVTGVRNDYLKGVTAERLIVLDLARILADPRIIVREELDA